MIFDGQVWRRSKTVVTLPREHWLGDIKNHVTFGRLCKPNAKGAVKTEWYPSDAESEDTLYAKPIECDGHPLTNEMFGKDGHKYLFFDGRVYVRPYAGKKPIVEVLADLAAGSWHSTPTLPEPSGEALDNLAQFLLKAGGNLFQVAPRFGIDPKLGDRLFDLLKEHGVFKCELCDRWSPIAERDKDMAGDVCESCVSDVDDA